jgi:hypothetical protein
MVKDSLINQQLKATYLETSILKKLNDLSYKALNGTRQPMRGENENIVQLGKIPFKNQPTDEITEERILEYKKNLDKPARIDTTSGDAFKFYDIPNVALNAPPPLIDDPDLSRPAEQKDVDDINILINKIITIDIPDIEAEIININNNFLKNKYRLDNLPATASTSTKNTLKKKIADLERDLRTKERELQKKNDDITNLGTIKQQYKDNIKENENIINQNRINNENTVRKYVEDLKAINRDKFFIEQQPNEDLGAYLTRAEALQNEKLDLTLYDDNAKLEQIRIFKENLKLLIRSDVIIENVVKAFTDNEIFEINKNFNTIQNNFIEAYGYNNKNINDMDIINFIKDILNNISSIEIEEEVPATSITPNIGLKPLKDATGTADTIYSFEIIDNAFYVINNNSKKYIFLKIGIDTAKTKYVFYSKTTNDLGSFTQVLERLLEGKDPKDKWSYIHTTYLNLDAYAFDELFNSKKGTKDLYDFLEKNYKLTPLKGIKKVRAGNRNFSVGITGNGIGIQKINNIPKHIDFGNVVLLLNQLYFKNKLSIKYKSLSEIKGFKSVKVSDNFVDLIMNILNGKEYTDKIKLLKTDEKELFNLLLYKSGIHKIVPNETDDVRQKLKERFLITEGQIISGNNNPAVYKELEDLTWKISHLGGFSKKVAEAYLKQFK